MTLYESMVGSGIVEKIDCFYSVLYLGSDSGQQNCCNIVQDVPHSDILDRLSYIAAILDISV